MADIVKLVSEHPFPETVLRLQSALEENGFRIFTVIDQQEAARLVGLDMPPTTLIIYGNPKGGTPLMLSAPDFAIELPLKLLVRQDPDGRAIVIYTPAASLDGRHGLARGLAARLGAAEPLIASVVGRPPP